MRNVRTEFSFSASRSIYALTAILSPRVLGHTYVSPISHCQQFDKFDVDGSGHLDRKDLERIIADSRTATSTSDGHTISSRGRPEQCPTVLP